MRRALFFCLFFAVSGILFAQEGLYMPRNFLRLYEKGTRSRDGRPGPEYWQNTADYRIRVSLTPKKRLLRGTQTVTYTNNSPDTLTQVRFKLAHDRYRKGSLRSEDVAASDVTDEGVRIASLRMNGSPVPESSRRRGNTFLTVRLGENRIPPGSSASFEVEWSYTLPADENAARECVCDPTTFFVPYWYPQIAVYDDIRGWADFPYTGTQEFYHDFANYDVTIEMPAGFMVWATGEWQNPEDILLPEVLAKWKQAHASDNVVSIWKEDDLKARKVFRKNKTHVLRYKAEMVPDFAFAASDHYNWDAASVVVDSASGRRTFVSAAYDSDSKDFYSVASIAAQGVHLMSHWLPGYPFPYPCITVFNGNDGMEYPMMVNDASVSPNFVTSLTVHEVAHTYFPFMMGINEQDFAWMDEGWANFFDYYLADSIEGKKTPMRAYSGVAGTDYEVPPMVRSRFLSGSAYGVAAYSRPQAAYSVLLDLLGYETFHRCMVTYMDRWKGKHPMPYDFFYTWNEVSGQDLNWFWTPWFFEWGYPDLAVEGCTPMDGFDRVRIKKVGNLPIPVNLEIRYADGSTEQVTRSAEVWKNGAEFLDIDGQKGKQVTSAALRSLHYPDSGRNNDKWEKN